MSTINFLNHEVYNDSLELFFKRGLRNFVKNRYKTYELVENMSDGSINLDIKSRFSYFVPKMRGLKVLYFPDNLERAGDVFYATERLYDIVFFAHTNELIDNKRYFHLPVAYDPYTHRYIVAKKAIDVAFVGTKHTGREFIQDVPNIQIYGNDWNEEVYPIYGSLKAKMYSKTKIMINHHVAGDTSPNMRTFECLAMGTFLLSDLVPKELEGGMVKYDSFDDLLTKIAFYLEHEDEREARAKKGRELVQPFTYEARMTEMMEVIEQHAT